MNVGNRDEESAVRNFYDDVGWRIASSGHTHDAEAAEDLRSAASAYVTRCRSKLVEHLPDEGDLLLDAGSGPIQYPEYLTYSDRFRRRICVDLSQRALVEAREKLGSEKGVYINTSITRLPFADASADAVVSLHVIYHVPAEDQALAVFELLRVCRPGSPILVVYSNPNRPLAWVRRLLRRTPHPRNPYFHAYPLKWWRRFEATAAVEMLPWRLLTAGESRRLIPDNRFGERVFRLIAWLESSFPRAALHLGAYPMIILRPHHHKA